MPTVYVALTHYPVVNRNGDVIASAVTNLDLHDISRAAKTYGVKAFYVVTPLDDQKELVQRIVSHWTIGAGGIFNPLRRKALELIKVMTSLADVVEDIAGQEKLYPKTVVTCAQRHPACIGYDECRAILTDRVPYLLVFGTAWGLADAYISAADHILEPIVGASAYNHLSVRSAAAIILDRLLGERK